MVREIADEGGVGGRGSRASTVIEMRDVEDQAELFFQFGEEEREHGRVGAT